MNDLKLDTQPDRVRGRDFQVPEEGFDVSWVGEFPLNEDEDIAFGSEDGRLLTTDRDVRIKRSLNNIAPSREAVNGVAFSGSAIAVTTRCEVVFLDLGPNRDGRGTGAVFEAGAHHVVSTASGLFVAPLGPSGILIADPRSQPLQECTFFRPKFGAVNFYKISPLARVGDGEILVCAARKQGLFVLTVDSQIEAASSYQRPGLDIVDVCSLSTPHRPFAAAALSREGEIYLFDDVRGDPEPVVFAGGPGDETFYSILHSKGDMFALTSRALYAFPGLALRGAGPSLAPTETPFSRMPIDAVEMYLVHDRLFILLTDRLFEVSLDSLVGTTRTSIPIITPPPTIWGSSRPDEWSTSKQPLRAVA